MRLSPRRLALLVLATAAVAALRGAPVRAEDDDGRTRSVPDKNVKLTIPAEWTWDELPTRDKEAGFVLVARREVKPEVANATARVRVVDAGGASLESLMGTVKDKKTQDLSDATSNLEAAPFAGLDGQKLTASGKHSNGAHLAFTVFGAVSGGRFYQLDVRCTNGAEDEIGDDVATLAAGFALLDGVAGGAPDHPGGDGGGAVDAASLTRAFPGLGLTWTLPKPTQVPSAKEGEPPTTVRWGWANAGKPDMKHGDKGLVARAGLVGPEDKVLLEVTLVYQDAGTGMTAQGVVEFEQNFKDIAEAFSDQPAPRVDTEAEVGNWRGASRSYQGKDKNDPPRPLFVKVWFVALKGGLFRITLVAAEKAEQEFKDHLRGVIGGLSWADTKEGVRGPWLTPFPSHIEDRKDASDLGKDVAFKGGGVQVKKPASFGRLKIDGSLEPYKGWAFGGEARKEGAYAFVGARKFPWAGLQSQTPKEDTETLIDKFEADWKNAVGEPVTLTQRNGKANKKPDGFAGGKGHAYEFKGTVDGRPILERGWVVQAGANAWWVRVQFVGKDAEAALGKDAQSLVKSLKFTE